MRYRGIVQTGEKRGTKLGFPTVNIGMNADGEHASGIFVAAVVVAGKTFPAAVYADPARHIIEAHIVDYSGDLYGKEIEVELLEKIRDGETFPGEEALKEAIASDVAKARAYFKN